jgi:hypothetical protein
LTSLVNLRSVKNPSLQRRAAIPLLPPTDRPLAERRAAWEQGPFANENVLDLKTFDFYTDPAQPEAGKVPDGVQPEERRWYEQCRLFIRFRSEVDGIVDFQTEENLCDHLALFFSICPTMASRLALPLGSSDHVEMMCFSADVRFLPDTP